MINNKKVLAWIPARGGSKGIKNKNIVDLCGKPLISYTIEAANKSIYIDRVMVSTDSIKIARIAEKYGAWVPDLRPAYLSGDHAKTIDAVVYSINLLKKRGERYEVFCLLQPTSPLRTTEDIDNALRTYMKNGEKEVAAVSPVQDHPLLIRDIDDNGALQSILNEKSTCRRQDMKQFYRVNGSIYINSTSSIENATSFNDNMIPYIMKESHSVDIDRPLDLLIAKYWLEN